jgi:hypothetical protein
MAKLFGDDTALLNELYNYVTRKKEIVRLPHILKLAILRQRIPFNVFVPEISSEMVARYLSWCAYISDDRDYVLSVSPSEPAIADAASVLLATSGLWPDVLKTFHDMCSFGVVDPGIGGETVMAILLLLARDLVVLRQLTKNHSGNTEKMLSESMFAAVKLGDLLDGLFGSDVTKNIAQATKARAQAKNLLDLVDYGMVSFNHFVKLSDTPTQKQLMSIFARGAAILCKSCQRGIDIIIPVLLPTSVQETCNPEQDMESPASKKPKMDNSENPMLKYRLDKKYLTYMLFQVKNHEDGIDKEEETASTTKMQPSFTTLFCPEHLYLTAYVQLGGKPQPMKIPEYITSREKTNHPEWYKRVSFAIYGLESIPVFRHPGLFSKDRFNHMFSDYLAESETQEMLAVMKGLAGQPMDMKKLFKLPQDQECVERICHASIFD